MNIHPTAVVYPGAVLGENVAVGPWVVVEDRTVIGRGTRIGAFAVIRSWTEVGEENEIHPYASLGEPPQDVGYRGEETRLVVGHRNRIREFVTLHRGTPQGGGVTVIGDDNLFMAYAHVAHDSRIGSHIIMANAVQMGGHTHIDDFAVIGGLTAIHQYVRVGAYCMVGGVSALNQDAPPYMTVAGYRAALHGLNLTGLQRRGFPDGTIAALKKAYRIIFRSGLTFAEAREKVASQIQGVPEVDHLVDFIASSKKGVSR